MQKKCVQINTLYVFYGDFHAPNSILCENARGLVSLWLWNYIILSKNQFKILTTQYCKQLQLYILSNNLLNRNKILLASSLFSFWGVVVWCVMGFVGYTYYTLYETLVGFDVITNTRCAVNTFEAYLLERQTYGWNYFVINVLNLKVHYKRL